MSDDANTGNCKPRFTRRRFVAGAGAAATIVTTGFGVRAFADEPLTKVRQDDPMAKALNYVHDARTVDAAKRFSNRFCNNCVLFAGSEDAEWGGCSIFPGKQVAGAGWCSAWAPRAGQ